MQSTVRSLWEYILAIMHAGAVIVVLPRPTEDANLQSPLLGPMWFISLVAGILLASLPGQNEAN